MKIEAWINIAFAIIFGLLGLISLVGVIVMQGWINVFICIGCILISYMLYAELKKE